MTDTPQTARDDTPAIAAYATRYGLDAEAGAADWRFLVEGDREHWREVADGKAAADAEPEAGSCPHGDLAAELRELRAQADVAAAIIRDVLESLCRRDGLPLESSVTPGEPAGNYELADRLGVGHVFGLQPQSAAPEPAPEPGTALYLSAIARLSAGLREVRHVCERGDAPHAIAPVAVAALADAYKLQLPQPQPAPELLAAQAERDKAYGERADLVAFIAAAHTDAVIVYQDEDDEWPVVIIETRAGQLSWHIAKADLGAFQAIGVPVIVGESRWDGHDTPEKYRRLAELTKAVGMSAPAEWAGVDEWPDPENPVTGRTPRAAAAPELYDFVPGDGPLALRPLLSATVVVAAGGVIDDDRKAMMTAAFAQDGLRAVFVENATAIGELPPDPALRADLGAMAARWADQAVAHNRDAGKATRSPLEAAALLAKARVYDANAAEVREAIGGEPGA